MKKVSLCLFSFIFCSKSFAFNIGMDCASVVNQLGGLKKVDILWLENLNEKKYQYVLINLSNKDNKNKFYLCGNTYNIQSTSDNTINVLSERNLQLASYNSIEIFTEIFSLTSMNSRKYIMQRLNLDDFRIDKNQLNQAYIAGLMKLNDRLSASTNANEKKITKKEEEKKFTTDKTETKQIEVTQKTTKDKTPPKIIIDKNLTFNQASYKLEGKVLDEGSKNIYVEIDGVVQTAKDGKFSFERFSPVNETIKIIAIDQWGNRSKEKIVKVNINLGDKKIANKLEKLNPNKIKVNQLSRDKVAIIIGIEKYDRTPKASYANLDAKYFFEYARLSFGIPTENIKLLVDKDANLIQSLGALKKWLPGKINKNKTELVIFAGHGLASNDGEELYLLPQDSDPDLLERTALSRGELFDIVSELSPKSNNVF